MIDERNHMGGGSRTLYARGAGLQGVTKKSGGAGQWIAMFGSGQRHKDGLSC